MDSRSSLAGCTESAVFRFAWTGCFFACLFYLVDDLETRQAHLKLTIVRRVAPSINPSDVIHFFFARTNETKWKKIQPGTRF